MRVSQDGMGHSDLTIPDLSMTDLPLSVYREMESATAAYKEFATQAVVCPTGVHSPLWVKK
jgi:hypothetical protein